MKKIQKSYKLRIYPTNEQISLLAKHFGRCRPVYHRFLEERKEKYYNEKTSPNYHDSAGRLTELKKQEEFAWSTQVNGQSLQSAAKNPDTAFKRFFCKQAKFSRFKSNYDRQSFKVPQNVLIKGGSLAIPNFKEGIKLNIHRPMEGGPLFATVHRDINTAKNRLKQGLNLLPDSGAESNREQKRNEALPLGKLATPEAGSSLEVGQYTKKILLLGAGKSATTLIKYLSRESKKEKWQITLVDQDVKSARKKAGNNPRITVLSFDIQNDETTRKQQVAQANLVISLLPASLHLLVAQDCIYYRKHLLTASYLSPEVLNLEPDVKKAGVLFMGEMGLDPGIDHMSAMKAVQQIKEKGGMISAFESFCGALPAPQSDDNPWHYKISWSPRSLITAGKDGASYREKGHIKNIPYERLFSSYRMIDIPDLGSLAYYPNRDSERYAKLYRLNEVPTVLRATLRHPDFCTGWQTVVKLGLTDTTTPVQTNHLTYSNWLSNHIKQSGAEQSTTEIFKAGSLLHRQFSFLGLTKDKLIGKGSTTSGDLLLELLAQKLVLLPDDKDMVVMFHRLHFKEGGQVKTHKSALIAQGENSTDTAIAKTVGLPLGILTKLLLNGTIELTGLHIPILPEIYLPVLRELEKEGIRFVEYVH